MRFCKLAAIALVIGGGAIGSASAQHYDVLTVGDNGKLITGGYDDSNNTKVAPLRVFEGAVVPDGAGNPYLAESPGEPGFRAVSQTDLDDTGNTGSPDFIANMAPAGVYDSLPANTDLSFDWMTITIGANTRNIFFWDGIGSVNFAPVASSYEVSLAKFGGGGFTETINGGDASIIPGNVIQKSSGTGTVHTHLFTGIGNFNGVDYDAPDQGFYLYSLRLRMDGFTNSDPAFFIFGALDPGALSLEELEEFEDAHGAAAAWVEANLVPEPSAALLALMGLAGYGLTRRRQARG